MTREEFEEKTGAAVTTSDYEIVEFIYTWHPSISNVKGKEQVAWIYKNLGMAPFHDMIPTAREAKRLDQEYTRLQHQIHENRADMESLLHPDRCSAIA